MRAPSTMMRWPRRGLTACSARGPAGLAGAVLEEGLESGAHGGLVGDAEVGELVERGVVGFDGFVGGFEVEGGHG